MKLLKLLLTTSISFNLIACGGPKPTTCISSPKEDLLHCYDYAKSKSFLNHYSAIDNWVCLSPVDFQDELESCKRHQSGPALNVCIAATMTELVFHCFDEKTQSSSLIKVSDTENYVCMSADDHKIMLDYCKQNEAKP